MATIGVQQRNTGANPGMFSKQNMFSRALHGRKVERQDLIKPKKPARHEPTRPIQRTRLAQLQCQRPQVEKECAFDLSKLHSAINDVVRKTPSNVVDIDVRTDYFHSPVYAQDIIDYSHKREVKFQICRGYLVHNPAVTMTARAVLTDWLISVQNYCQMESETIHLAVALLDQYLARHKIALAKLQLLGITCILVAAKFHERFPPTFETLLTLTENAYTEREVIKTELLVLKALEYEVNIPTPNIFLDRYLQVVEAEASPALARKVRCATRYLLDLSLTDMKMVPVLPSVKAAGAVWLARRLILSGPDGGQCVSRWPASLVHYTAMSEDSVQSVAQRYAYLLTKAQNDSLQGARTKHSSKSRAGRISFEPALTNTEMLNRIVGMNVTSL